MNLISILFPQTVFKTTSKFSGEIKVVDHALTRRLIVGGLTQSGGILEEMWKRALRELNRPNGRTKLKIKNILILGLGAGTVIQVISKKWPDAKMVGVEIDPAMIDIGKKYFHLDKIKNLQIIIEDAIRIVNNETMKQLNNYDLIIVDLYKGYAIEKRIKNRFFLQKIAQLLEKNGVVIFNVISRQNDDFEASIFLDKLHVIFKDNFCKRIIVNDIFFCRKAPPLAG